MSTHERPLGMRPPTDSVHRARYGLTADTAPTKPTPVVAGWNWYSAFDNPYTDEKGIHWLVKPGSTDFGRLRGGHCVCLATRPMHDLTSWWQFYDQGEEGACVGFGWCRALSIMNRSRYDGFSHYHLAQQLDEWPGEDYDGTSVRAGGDVARDYGGFLVWRGKNIGCKPMHGIRANRWAYTVEDMAACLSPEDQGASVLNLGYVLLKNSWGQSGYPFETRATLEVIERLTYKEGGEMTVITDK